MARLVLMMLLCVSAFCAEALTFSNRFRSPRNRERHVRRSTSLVVLHTTEAHARSSLNKLSERGEAHYCVVENGTVFRIIDQNRVAFHAGCSMWNGREECDNFSIGIEVVGYHNRPITSAQVQALRELLAQLKKTYSLTDGQIVCHSHVAYGNPNKWHSFKHRGRKRCGMQFATWSLRKRLGLTTRPASDPDVVARRLRVGDPYLHEVLYGTRVAMSARAEPKKEETSFMRRLFAHNGTASKDGKNTKKSNVRKAKEVVKVREVEKDAQSTSSFKKGRLVVVDETELQPPASKQVVSKQAAPKQVASKQTASKQVAAKKSTQRKVTQTQPVQAQSVVESFDETPEWEPVSKNVTASVSFEMPDEMPDEKTPYSLQELVTCGAYVKGGPVRRDRGPMSIAGRAWRSAETYYLFRGKVTPGNKIDPARISPGTYVFYRKP